MSQTNAIASINSLLLQLPDPLQVEALHYVEYLVFSEISQIKKHPDTPKRNDFDILKRRVAISDDFYAFLEAFL